MIELTNDQLLEIWDGCLDEDPFEDVENLGVTDSWRWGTVESKIVKHKETGKFYQLTATFQVEEGIVDPIQVCEVRPQKKTTIEWVSV